MDRPKKLAFLLPDFAGGGAERVALRLIGDFLAKGHEVDLLLLRARGELLDLLPAGARVIDLDVPRMARALGPLIRYFRTERPHALQASMWPLTIIAVLAHRLARSKARLVLSDHTVLSRHYAGFGRLRTWLMRLGIRRLYPLANARVIVSKLAADDLAAFSGLPRSSIEVVYNPVTPPPVPCRPDQSVEALWGDAGHRILTVGKLKEEKNHLLLIRAFAALRRTHDARLIIVGEGALRPRLEQAAAEAGVAEHVRLPGYAADPWPYYRSAELFVLSSDFEGFGLVLAEAMRSGLKLVSTDCEAGPREILEDGAYGILVPCGDAEALADAMRRALDRPADPAAQVARAERISGQATSDRYLALMLGTA